MRAISREMARIGIAAYAASAPQGMPNKFYEYMAFGLPIVSSLAGEADLWLSENHCGLSYTANKPDSLIDALTALTTNQSLCREYGENGRSMFHRYYSSDRVYAAMIDYLESLAASPAQTVAASQIPQLTSPV